MSVQLPVTAAPDQAAMAADMAALTRQLRMLGNQAMRLAADVAARDAAEADRAAFDAYSQDSDMWLTVAQDIYRERQRRREFFDGDLFGEPAWDMLLDLYICDRQGKRVSVTAACLGAGVPETTALRWLKQLEKNGLLLREADRRDGRRSFVRLSELGYAKMTAYLQANRPAAARSVMPVPLAA